MNADPTKATRQPLKRVISVCEKKDIHAWRIASGRIVRYVQSESYQLICPESQMRDFQSVSHPDWVIEGEEDYSAGCGIDHIHGMVSGQNTCRVNWLFQQFLKINAIRNGQLDDADTVLIWDADTVPLRKLGFFENDSGCLSCYHGKEKHLPYFRTIEKLFGPGKATDQSFIAQCLPVRVGWVRAMIAEIEERFSMSYVDAILRLLPGESGSEFSEYETIGNWVMLNHPGEITFKNRNQWLRDGSCFLGKKPSVARAAVVLWILSNHYDYVALENWNRPMTVARLIGILSRKIGFP